MIILIISIAIIVILTIAALYVYYKFYRFLSSRIRICIDDVHILTIGATVYISVIVFGLSYLLFM